MKSEDACGYKFCVVCMYLIINAAYANVYERICVYAVCCVFGEKERERESRAMITLLFGTAAAAITTGTRVYFVNS